MQTAINELFRLATHFPKLTGIRKHVEPNTGDCANIESIGIVVRSVNVEFIRYKHCGDPQTLVMIHSTDRGSSMFMCNNRILVSNDNAGKLLYKLILSDLQDLVDEANNAVFRTGMSQLESSNSIRRATPVVSDEQADDFIHKTSGGEFATVSDFYSDNAKG